jgi:hypothetical protein
MKKPDKNKPVFQIFPHAWELIEANKCPICRKDIKEEEYTEEDKEEYSISGLCPECIKDKFS